MRKQIHMIKRDGVYHFRRRVPEDLLSHYSPKPDLGFARVCLFGGLALLFGNGSLPLGISSMILGGLWWFLATPKYAVVIHTTAGNIQALIGKDVLDVEIVLSALNIALSLRDGVTTT